MRYSNGNRIDPNDVDEVPVETAHLHWRIPLAGELALPRHPRDHHIRPTPMIMCRACSPVIVK